jgi:hypothetical protein
MPMDSTIFFNWFLRKFKRQSNQNFSRSKKGPSTGALCARGPESLRPGFISNHRSEVHRFSHLSPQLLWSLLDQLRNKRADRRLAWHPIVSAIQLFECLPFADAEREFAKLLKARLEAMPEFDPEGWALRLVV